MQTTYVTSRLFLSPLSADDAAFICELVNTEGWLRFIGDRKVTDHESAVAYIQKIMDNANVIYWVVRIKDVQKPIGVITLIKRDYLDFPDIGFAFLPAHAGKGYAYEAVKTVLDSLNSNPTILAITVQDNTRSIQLLEKLGFNLDKEVEQEGGTLLVYT